jgi:hypothetical protein
MPRNKQMSSVIKERSEHNQLLNKLEAGINSKLGDKSINELYKEKLSLKLDVDEPIGATISKAPKVKKEKPVKEVSEKGKRASANLSKYRQQVREALDLKKSLEKKSALSYDDDDDDDDEEDEPNPVVAPIVAPVQPQVNLDGVYSEIDALKKQNKTLEERLIFRRDVLGISDLRRQMTLRF